MLTLFRRHLKSCPQKSRRYRRCACPIQVEGSLGGETARRAMDQTSPPIFAALIHSRISFSATARDGTPVAEDLLAKQQLGASKGQRQMHKALCSEVQTLIRPFPSGRNGSVNSAPVRASPHLLSRRLEEIQFLDRRSWPNSRTSMRISSGESRAVRRTRSIWLCSGSLALPALGPRVVPVSFHAWWVRA
jgi:hypothetical protein